MIPTIDSLIVKMLKNTHTHNSYINCVCALFNPSYLTKKIFIYTRTSHDVNGVSVNLGYKFF